MNTGDLSYAEITVIRYIHQNPVKAGIAKSVDEYVYSSYNEYINDSNLVDTQFILEIFGKEEFIKYQQMENEDKCLENDYSKYHINDIDAKRIIKKISKCENVEEFLKLDKDKKEKYIRILKEKGLSIRQISRLTE